MDLSKRLGGGYVEAGTGRVPYPKSQSFMVYFYINVMKYNSTTLHEVISFCFLIYSMSSVLAPNIAFNRYEPDPKSKPWRCATSVEKFFLPRTL